MNNYQERQNAKLERYQELAEKNKQRSTEAYNHSTAISERIPFGQPILIGHHSEKRHRRDIERIHNLMDKSIQEQEKAEYYNKKVENILNPSAISSDNPEAINLLKEKLKDLEAKRERLKEHNKQAKKENKEILPSYVLSNLSQNINSIRKRVEYLERLKAIPEAEEIINGVVIKTDKEDNRIKLLFPNIPKPETREKLKRNGFRWSPYNKAWQRQISEYALFIARDILKEKKEG